MMLPYERGNDRGELLRRDNNSIRTTRAIEKSSRSWPEISMILWLWGRVSNPPPHKPLVVKFVYANFAVTSIESFPSPSNAQSLASRPSADGDPARVTLPLVSYTERRF